MAHFFESEFHSGRGYQGPITPDGPIASSGEKPQNEVKLPLYLRRGRSWGGRGSKTQFTEEQLAEQIAGLPARVEKTRRNVGEALAALTTGFRDADARQEALRKQQEEEAALRRRFWGRR